MFPNFGIRSAGLLGRIRPNHGTTTWSVEQSRQDFYSLGIFDVGDGVIVCHAIDMAIERSLKTWSDRLA